MKKAICICGSPNRNGSTARLLAEISHGMADAGIEAETFHLGDMELHCCLGCNACRDSRQCAQKDDMSALTEALLAADVVCIGSPSYWGDVTAQLKTFIDRSLPLCNTLDGGTTVPCGKLGIAVAVRAGHSAGESMGLIDTIEHYYGHLGVKAAARLHAEGINGVEDLQGREDILREAYHIGFNIPENKKEKAVVFNLAAATAEDAPELAGMNRGLIQDEGSDNPMTLPELEQRMKGFLAGEYRGLLIKADGVTAGYCLYAHEEGHNGGGPGVYLRQYYIKPECRRLGLGRAALKGIIETSFAGAAFVALDVLENNTAGKAFWSSAGFRPMYRRMLLTK